VHYQKKPPAALKYFKDAEGPQRYIKVKKFATLHLNWNYCSSLYTSMAAVVLNCQADITKIQSTLHAARREVLQVGILDPTSILSA
jgi:hypothetical protein